MLSLLNFIDLTAVIIFIVLLALWIIFNGFVLYSEREAVKKWSFGEMSMYLAMLALSVILLLFAAIVFSVFPKAMHAAFQKLVF